MGSNFQRYTPQQTKSDLQLESASDRDKQLCAAKKASIQSKVIYSGLANAATPNVLATNVKEIPYGKSRTYPFAEWKELA